jgi:excinuclease ABC subunit C
LANIHPDIKKLLVSLPEKPGVYKHLNEEGTILYVGKAKNLKKRVSSYFHKEPENAKTRLLVRQIVDVQYIVVATDFDALLLENNLIKKLQPKYNILLRDDKTYPWIKITKERFPRIFSTRHVTRDGSQYYGPYASVKMMHTILDLVKQLYPLRTCKYNLSEANITAGKYKECLEYHLGNCKAPCVGWQPEAEYDEYIVHIRDIIKGNISSVLKDVKTLMKKASEDLDFELAQMLKDKLELLERYQAKSTVVTPSITNSDVFTIISDVQNAYVNYLKVHNGAIIQGHTIEIKKKLDESDQDLLAFAIVDLRERLNSSSNEIYTNIPVDIENEDLKFTIPQRGDKKSLIDLSLRNGKYYRMDRLKNQRLTDPERHTKRILETIKKDLRLKETPEHIECFDNSNFQGTNAVAACVVFKNAKPAKKEYRHFNIKTVVGPDDFASMEEVVFRRYRRLLDEQKSLPQLIVIDGGKGQLSSAVKSLEKLGLRGKIAIIGIAKKLEEIYFPDDSVPLYIDKKSESLKVIQNLRNEAHRFGINHHRNKRSKGALQSEILDIKGIGEKTQLELIKVFKSVKRIKDAPLSEIEEVIGKAKAKILWDSINKVK